MNTGQINAARVDPMKGPTIYIQICLIDVLSLQPLSEWVLEGENFIGLSEKEEIFDPKTFKDIKVKEILFLLTAPK